LLADVESRNVTQSRRCYKRRCAKYAQGYWADGGLVTAPEFCPPPYGPYADVRPARQFICHRGMRRHAAAKVD